VPDICRVDLAGPLPASRVELIQSRFGDITPRLSAGMTILEGPVADQSALRALLNLLWDAGSEVRAFRVTKIDEPGRRSAS
jgi:hypothetical protein